MTIVANIRTPIFQIGLVTLSACVGTYATKDVGPSAANLIWLLLVPALIGILLNGDMTMRAGMACVLVLVSALSCIAFMAVVWGGY